MLKKCFPISFIALTLFSSAYASDNGWQICPEKRAKLCIEIYEPVCGEKDTNIRCITEPCPSYTYEVYSNSCKACADPDVKRYKDGECKNDKD